MSSVGEATAATGRAANGLHDEKAFLARAAELVARGWSQQGLARDRNGRPVEPWSDGACSWSPVGALIAILYQSGGGWLDAFQITYEALALATGGRLEEWNAAPWRRRRHVLSAFVRAREYLPLAQQHVWSQRGAPEDGSGLGRTC